MVVDGTRHEVYLSAGYTGIDVIDYSAKIVKGINLSSGNNGTLSEGEALVGSTLYVVTNSPAGVDAIDTSTMTVTTQLATPSLTSPTQLVDAGGKLWTDTTTSSGDCLASVDPNTGAVLVYQGVCFSTLFLRGNPFNSSMLIAFDGKASTSLTTLNVSGSAPTTIQSRVTNYQITDIVGASSSALLANDLVSGTALELQYSNLEPDGIAYTDSTGAVTAVAATPDQGGLVAAADSGTQVTRVYHSGQASDFTATPQCGSSGVPAGGVAFAADGSEAFTVCPDEPGAYDFTAALLFPPKLTAVSPPHGPSAGGTVVTVSGANFFAGTSSCQVTSVLFYDQLAQGSAPEASPRTCTDTAFTFVLFAGTPDTGDLLVRTALTQTSPTSADQFTFDPIDITAVSTQQYSLSGNDGSTWAIVDPSHLSVSFTAKNNAFIMVSANADLWTATPGLNQDLAIMGRGQGASQFTAYSWTESGGAEGTYSPNAAADQVVWLAQAGFTYTFTVGWKTNVPEGAGEIFMGAGRIGNYSPTRITAHIVAPSSASYTTSTFQYGLSGDDGSTWYQIDSSGLTSSWPAAHSGAVVAGASAALWTENAGLNQDLGIFVSDDGGPFSLAAWKESGGNAGTYSPNAAFVQAVVGVTAGHRYTFTLALKSNVAQSADEVIAVGAGSGGPYGYSPTHLTLQGVPSELIGSIATYQQPTLTNSDGSSWSPLEPSTLDISVTPPYDQAALVSFNADLWTATAGYNQDIGLFVSVDYASPVLVGWKESGGYAGTFSPNAAFLQVAYPMSAGHHYEVTAWWKTNKPSGATIYAGAGPDYGYFSPSRLTVQVS